MQRVACRPIGTSATRETSGPAAITAGPRVTTELMPCPHREHARLSTHDKFSPSLLRFQQLLWPLLTSGSPSQHLAMLVALGRPPDLPGYCAHTFTLMPVGSTSCRSVQVSGFDDIGRLTPPPRLYPLPVRQASALPTASSRFRIAPDTLAVRLTLPPVRRVMDLHHQVGAPCRAHKQKGTAVAVPLQSVRTTWIGSARPRCSALAAMSGFGSVRRAVDH